MWNRHDGFSRWDARPNGGATLIADEKPDGGWIAEFHLEAHRPRGKAEGPQFTFSTREEAETAARNALIQWCAETIEILGCRGNPPLDASPPVE